jgi:hypothetical protein
MILLVSLDDAKTHLRITNDDSDADVEMKVAQASAIVLQDLGLDTVPAEWLVGSPPTIEPPDNVTAKTLLWVSELYENREAGVINPNLKALDAISPRRPVIA